MALVQGFDLSNAAESGGKRVESFVRFIGKREGVDSGELADVVRVLEENHPFAGDKVTNDFGGGRQHHLRDFSHHASPAGLACSLFTQFTGKAIGVKTNGAFTVVDIPSYAPGMADTNGNVLIGATVQEKLYVGTIQWFLHLASDMAGSSSTAGASGGTGIPGPLMSLVRMFASIPGVREMVVATDPQGRDVAVSQLASKLFNGTWLADHDETGTVIRSSVRKFDLRMEVGLLEQLGSQALPVLLNEAVVRVAFALRRLACQLEEIGGKSRERGDGPLSLAQVADEVDWSAVRPWNNRSVDRMLTVATGVFTATDVAESVVRGVLSRGAQPIFGRVNVVGVGRFAVALGTEFAYAVDDAGGPFAVISAIGEFLMEKTGLDALASRLASTGVAGQEWEYRKALEELYGAAFRTIPDFALPLPVAMARSAQHAVEATRQLCAGAISGPEFIRIMATDVVLPLSTSLTDRAPGLVAAAGAFPAFLWASVGCSCFAEVALILRETYAGLEAARGRRIQVERLCREKMGEVAASRALLENLGARYLGEQSAAFAQGLAAMDAALVSADDDGFIAAQACIQEALGRPAAFCTAAEFDALMDSAEDFKL